MRAPVALILFNRPDTTEKVFSEIAKAKPPKLFVVADGHREQHPDDVEKCVRARSIVENIDWECEVLKNYSEVNLGCGNRPATGISWVFEHTDRAIILEDDCVPNQSFFRFCDDLLERYLDDQRIMQISGNNFQFGQKRGPFSYFFSRHNICAGGWATWRRAWKYHDMGLKLWPSLKDSPWLFDITDNQIAVDYWRDKFGKAYESDGEIDFWDYQWTFACWSQNGLSILPNSTLISNIGFRKDGTHTKNPNSSMANLPTTEMPFPLKHPQSVMRNIEADKFFIERVVAPKQKGKLHVGLVSKLPRKIFSILSFIFKRGNKIFSRLKWDFTKILPKRFFPVVLPYDNTHPVIYDKDEAINCYTDEYLLALASAGDISLVGLITSSSIAPYNQWVTSEDFERFLRQRDELISHARKSGLCHIPDHVKGTKGHLKKPASGKIEDTKPIGSEASHLIINMAQKASAVKPIVAVMCGPLTVMADAYLIEKSITDKVIVAWFGGRVDDMAGYNGNSDAWAAYIVLQRFSLVQFPPFLNGKGYFSYSPKVPKAELYNLPKSPLRKWMIEKRHSNGSPGNLDIDAPPAISLMRADYVIQAKKVSFSNWITHDNREIPAFKKDSSGKTIVVTAASQKVATQEWWRAMRNPKVFSD